MRVLEAAIKADQSVKKSSLDIQPFKPGYSATTTVYHPGDTSIDISDDWESSSIPLDLHNSRLLAIAAVEHQVPEIREGYANAAGTNGITLWHSVGLIQWDAPDPVIDTCNSLYCDDKNDRTVEFRNTSYRLPAWSVSILPDCKNVVFNTAKVNPQTNVVAMIPRSLQQSNIGVNSLIWVIVKEKPGIWGTTDFVKNGFVDFINTTKDTTDYLYGIPQEYQVGLQTAGPFYDFMGAGLTSVKIKGLNNGMIDLSSYAWTYKIGVQGEHLKLYQGDGLSNVNWTSTLEPPKMQPLTWYKTIVHAPPGDEPVGLDMLHMGKGLAWLNGEFVESYITTNKKIDASGNILGCFCFLQVVMPDLNRSFEEHKPIGRENISESKELAYILQEIETMTLAWSLSQAELVEGETEEGDLTPNKEGPVEGRELLEALKDIKDHLFWAYSFEKELMALLLLRNVAPLFNADVEKVLTYFYVIFLSSYGCCCPSLVSFGLDNSRNTASKAKTSYYPVLILILKYLLFSIPFSIFHILINHMTPIETWKVDSDCRLSFDDGKCFWLGSLLNIKHLKNLHLCYKQTNKVSSLQYHQDLFFTD
ncbi:hypothetical protein V8G54_005405 [Vigna mungo]|uniref:Beta-galactosidase n=1 Tax=Vigna mungo TaxID=3915 RepID=A0AAQ3P1G4_VIGMU